MTGNREYKSDVFSMLMEEPENALALYNAVNHSNYKDPALVEICMLDRGISLTVRNDASFVLDMNLSIYEHQSTICPNMPVRSLIYFTTILEQLLKDRNIYGRKLIKIPTPKFAVFYNGDENQPEQYELKLSDAFENPVNEPEIELTCRVYNINYGKNQELLAECSFLKEYMIFVDYVRENHKANGYKELAYSINMAIDRCIEEDVLREFLMKHRTEVVKVMELDYTFDRQLTLERADSRAEGLEEGRTEGLAEGLSAGRTEGELIGIIKGYNNLGKSKKDTHDYLMDAYQLPEEKVVELINNYWEL
ncbi:MAG: hypothetical protein NC300_12150 [Bacteroidales bacterium]|nr:hypothetical protein [Clostridium sp.]MCM1204884.1 hypothetical protein [Bacteroidales bacterium]